tara:strand:- start:278 stop:499 length:222 start_codon:yes stop_codon:yes gene_type:complete
VLYIDACEVFHLMSARDTGGDEVFIGFERSCGWQEPSLSDSLRNIKVVTAVAEGAGHATAAGVKVYDFCTWHA